MLNRDVSITILQGASLAGEHTLFGVLHGLCWVMDLAMLGRRTCIPDIVTFLGEIFKQPHERTDANRPFLSTAGIGNDALRDMLWVRWLANAE